MKWNRAWFVKRNSKEHCILCDSLSLCLHSANTLQPILTEDRHWARHRDTKNMTQGTCTDEENRANTIESIGREEVADSQTGEQPPSLATVGKSWKAAALRPPREHSQDKGTTSNAHICRGAGTHWVFCAIVSHSLMWCLGSARGFAVQNTEPLLGTSCLLSQISFCHCISWLICNKSKMT